MHRIGKMPHRPWRFPLDVLRGVRPFGIARARHPSFLTWPTSLAFYHLISDHPCFGTVHMILPTSCGLSRRGKRGTLRVRSCSLRGAHSPLPTIRLSIFTSHAEGCTSCWAHGRRVVEVVSLHNFSTMCPVSDRFRQASSLVARFGTVLARFWRRARRFWRTGTSRSSASRYRGGLGWTV